MRKLLFTTAFLLISQPALSQPAASQRAASQPAVSEADQTHRDGETLFSPTPRSQMRELSTDRPDQTESPYSVDPGHLQVESDVVSYAVTREAGVTLRELHLMNMNIRLGLTEAIDAQLVLLPFVLVRAKSGGSPSAGTEGFGDTTLRAKINLVGNDEGNFALGLLPFISLPTASNSMLGAGKAEYGLAVPMGLTLPGDFGLGAMLQVDLVGGATADYVAQLTETLTVGHNLIGDLGGFVEVVSTQSFEGGTDASFELHGGLTYGLTSDVQLDAGTFGTLVGSGEDLRMFLGLTVRR